MLRYKALVDPGHSFEPLDVDRLGEVTAAGRSNCLLDTTKLRSAGLGLQPVEQAVDCAMRQLAAALRAA